MRESLVDYGESMVSDFVKTGASEPITLVQIDTLLPHFMNALQPTIFCTKSNQVYCKYTSTIKRTCASSIFT